MATTVSRSLVGSEWRLTVAESPFPTGTAGQWTGMADPGGGGWAGTKVSQVLVQLATSPSSTARVSQIAVQIGMVAVAAQPIARVSQIAVQIMLGRREQPRITLNS